MDYLVFDIECSNGKHICEFGYVLFDEQFNTIKSECITINPESNFKLYGRKGISDMVLFFSEEEYLSSPTFPQVYDRIKSVLTRENCQILGFSYKSDKGFLSTAYDRYNLEHVEFDCLDFQRYYMAYAKARTVTSVGKIVEDLGLEGITLHKSVDDARAVMLALQRIANELKLQAGETIKFLQGISKNYRAERVKKKREELTIKVENNSKGARKKFLKYFRKTLTKGEEVNEYFTGKFVCVSMDFQEEHFLELLGLIDNLYKCGATYSDTPSKCDIFIEYALERNDARESVTKTKLSKFSKIEFISLEKALEILGITRQDLTKKNYLKGE